MAEIGPPEFELGGTDKAACRVVGKRIGSIYVSPPYDVIGRIHDAIIIEVAGEDLGKLA